jgi:PKHD-type hydroxylase
MTSKFFSNKNSFDSITDPVQQSWGPYWHLNSQVYEPYCWNTGSFTCDEIENIKVIGRRLEMNRAQTGGVGENCLDHRRSFTSWITSNQHTAWIYQKLTNLVLENNEKFFNFDLTMIENLQFTYYNSNEQGCYKAHVDPNVWQLPHNRKLSLVMQLSDPSEYEGGDLLLHTAHNPIVINKQKGMLVMFPSYTLHEVTPVTKGERYSLVAWVHGPKLR